MILLALLLQAAAPTPEALALARRLAETGALATMLPMMIDKDLADLAAERPSLTAAQRSALIATGRRLAGAQRDRLMAALADGYARRLSIADLRTLVATAETPAARRKREADLPVVAGAMQALGAFDLKKETAARFCRDTGALCDR